MFIRKEISIISSLYRRRPYLHTIFIQNFHWLNFPSDYAICKFNSKSAGINWNRDKSISTGARFIHNPDNGRLKRRSSYEGGYHLILKSWIIHFFVQLFFLCLIIFEFQNSVTQRLNQISNIPVLIFNDGNFLPLFCSGVYLSGTPLYLMNWLTNQ